ncbi:MAG: PAAR domain-containing protein [Litorilinea sp.]
MPPAVRATDPHSHGGVVVAGSPKVLIVGLPAARMGDPHTCPMFTGIVPHVGGAIAMGSFKVFISGQPAARVGDTAPCATGPPATLQSAQFKVMIN